MDGEQHRGVGRGLAHRRRGCRGSGAARRRRPPPTVRGATAPRRSRARRRRRRAAPSASPARRRASRGCRAPRPTAGCARARAPRRAPGPGRRPAASSPGSRRAARTRRRRAPTTRVDDLGHPRRRRCPAPAWRSATRATRRPSSAAGQPGVRSAPPGVTSERGSSPSPPGRRERRRPPMAAAAIARAMACRRRDVEVPADVVEAAAGRAAAEPGADLLELRGVERGAEAAESLAVVEPELGGELVALEQGHVVDAAGQRLRRLDLDRPVALEPGGRRDQLADDHVLLQAREAVDLALERRVRQHLRGLLEGGRREERVRRERRLRDAEDDLLERRRSRRLPPRPRSLMRRSTCRSTNWPGR